VPRRFNACVEVEIQPEPSAEERAAILAALEEVGGIAATPESPWGLPELDQSHADDPTGA
jgi:hypothetical protein